MQGLQIVTRQQTRTLVALCPTRRLNRYQQSVLTSQRNACVVRYQYNMQLTLTQRIYLHSLGLHQPAKLCHSDKRLSRYILTDQPSTIVA
jgi:hypothetical protein